MGTRNWLRRHPFFVIALFTVGLFARVETLRAHGAVAAAQQLAVPLRIIIIPMYLVWLGLTMLYVATVGPEPQIAPVRYAWAAVQLTGGLAPYLATDYLLRRIRRRSNDPRRHVA